MNGEAIPLLDLFAGYGGFSLAFEALDDTDHGRCLGTDESFQSGRHGAFRTVAFSEIDPYACELLRERWPDVPNLGPVQDVTAARLVDECHLPPAEAARLVVTGGFPCQPHSVAGSRQASDDHRDLWGQCARTLRDLRPRVALFENVPGLLSSPDRATSDGEPEPGLFFNRIVSDLAQLGYAALWQVLSAADVGAPHRRERVWIIAVDERWLADRERQGREGHAGTMDVRGEEPGRQRPEPDGSVGAGGLCRGGTVWPATHGLWPARPGEPQHEWEPPRVVGHTGREQRERSLDGTGRDAGAPGAGERQAEPALGGDADGSAAGLDATQPEVHQAPGDTVNRTHRLKALGNGIVPWCAVPIARAIAQVLRGNHDTP